LQLNHITDANWFQNNNRIYATHPFVRKQVPSIIIGMSKEAEVILKVASILQPYAHPTVIMNALEK
jgi:hypothetical protein